MDAEKEIKAPFDAHKCKLMDSSQNALRIVPESTKTKGCYFPGFTAPNKTTEAINPTAATALGVE